MSVADAIVWLVGLIWIGYLIAKSRWERSLWKMATSKERQSIRLHDDDFYLITSAEYKDRFLRRSYQDGVDQWLRACFSPEIIRGKCERNQRFLEEALELVQAGDCTAEEAHQLVDYVFGRPKGELPQEIGGVMNCLSALASAYDLNLLGCANREMDRCWRNIDKIRAKNAIKPKFPSPYHSC